MAQPQYERLSMFREATMRATPTFKPDSDSSIPHRSFNYKPTILRTIPLLSLFVLTVALIGVLEYVTEKLPHSTGSAFTLETHTLPIRRDLRYRNDSTSTSISYVLYTPTTTSAISSSSVSTTGSSIAVAASAAQSDYLTTSYVQTISLEATTAFTVQQSDYLNTDYTDASSVQQSNYVNTDYTDTISTTAPAPATPSPTTQSPQAITTSIASVINVPVSSGSPETANGAVVAVPAASSAQSGGTSGAISVATVSLKAVTLTSGSQTYVQTQGVATISGSVTTMTSLSSIVSQFAQSTTNVRLVTTITPAPSATAGPGSDASSPEQDDGAGKTMTVVHRFSVQQTFLGTYCAIAIAVIYRMLWTTLYNNFNLIEPFRQLAESKGALADRAFFTFYQSQSSLLGPIPALVRRRYLLAFAATAYLSAGLLPALASESVFVDTRWNCPNPRTYLKNPCDARLTVDPAVVRILQALLAFMALAILTVATILLFSKTGLPADPSSMATVASMMRNHQLLEDFHDIPADADSKLMRKVLKGKRYRLDHYQTASGEAGYGIVPISEVDADGVMLSVDGKVHRYEPVQSSMLWSDEPSHSHRWRFLDYVLALTVAGTFGVLLAYYLDGNDDGFNAFFGSNTFGPRFLLAGTGTVVASLWKSVEQSETVMAPYNRLTRKASPPRSTISFTPSTTPIVSTVKSVANGYFFVAAITCTTLLGEAANIVLAGVPYATGQTWQQFLASIYISMGVFAIMIIMAILVIISRTREPRIPRKPDTLGAVMSYMSGSRMLDDFHGFEWLDEETRDNRLRLLGKKYDFKIATRRDGKYAWAVDDNLARSSYQS